MIPPMNKKLQLFYGETVDEFGMPIDSLKYYFALSQLQKQLSAEATIVVADVASLLNDSAIQKQERIKTSLHNRIALLNKIIAVYGLPIKIRLMSDLFETNEYKILRKKVGEVDMKIVEPLLSQTVPINKLEEERKKNFRYALDAIATALLFDVKVGPPRERFYDEAGEKIMPGKLKSVYLTPTYPLGQNFAFFLTHPEIEEFGVTPYKAGSNKLQNYRIILDETPLERVKELIQTSFESLKPETAHPVFDLFEITQIAKRFLTGSQQNTTFVSVDQIRNATIQQVEKYIYKPLELL